MFPKKMVILAVHGYLLVNRESLVAVFIDLVARMHGLVALSLHLVTFVNYLVALTEKLGEKRDIMDIL